MSGGRIYNASGELVGEFDGKIEFEPAIESTLPVNPVGAEFEIRFDRRSRARLEAWIRRMITPRRTLDLRQQLKRKGRPGWKRIKPKVSMSIIRYEVLAAMPPAALLHADPSLSNRLRAELETMNWPGSSEDYLNIARRSIFSAKDIADAHAWLAQHGMIGSAA